MAALEEEEGKKTLFTTQEWRAADLKRNSATKGSVTSRGQRTTVKRDAEQNNTNIWVPKHTLHRGIYVRKQLG